MSIPFSQGKLQGAELKTILQTVQQQAKAAALKAIRPVLKEFLEAEVTAKLGRAKGVARQVSSTARPIDWQCASCGCTDANQFTRDGHYRRNLETGWGHLEDLQVPMLECQQCQHDVICSFTILQKYQRFWLDLDQDVLFSSGLCQSLREISQRWSATVGGSVGLRTLVSSHQSTRAVSVPSSSGTNHTGANGGATGWHLADHPEPKRKAEA